MGLLKKIIAWVAKKLSKEQKAELFDKEVDRWAGKEVVGPRHQMPPDGGKFIDSGTGSRLGRGKKQPIDKRGK